MAEHFWPLWPKADWTACLIASSRSLMAVTIPAFLPPVSAQSRRLGVAASMARAVSVPPVRITAETSEWATSLAPGPAPEQGRNCSVCRETPARQKHWHTSQATSTASEAGLRITVLPAASAAAIPPQGMAIGKFQGGTTTTTPHPCACNPSRSNHMRAAAR